MKNAIYSTIVALFISTTFFGQYSSIDREVINTNEVPQEVIQAQNRQFINGFVTGWKVHTRDEKLKDDVDYYVATFKKQGRMGNYAYYTKDGKLLAYSLFLDGYDLPENIQEYCFKNYNNANIKSAELIDLENPQQFIYRVRLNAEGLLTYLYFDNNGNLIDKYKLPKEIFLFI